MHDDGKGVRGGSAAEVPDGIPGDAETRSFTFRLAIAGQRASGTRVEVSPQPGDPPRPVTELIFDGKRSVLPEPKLTLPLVLTQSEVKVAPRTVAENPSHDRLTVPSFLLAKSGNRSVAAGSVDPAGDSVADTV